MSELNDYSSWEEMVKAHRVMLKSLLDKDGYYKATEAMEINNAFGKQVNAAKLKLEAYKLLKEVPKKEELFLLSAGKSKKSKK